MTLTPISSNTQKEDNKSLLVLEEDGERDTC
jgi:hypothetical protein